MRHGLSRREYSSALYRPDRGQLVAKKLKLAAVLIDRGAQFVRLPARSPARQFPEQVNGAMWLDQFFVSKMKMPKGATARGRSPRLGKSVPGAGSITSEDFMELTSMTPAPYGQSAQGETNERVFERRHVFASFRLHWLARSA
jgi:hypothetical protein